MPIYKENYFKPKHLFKNKHFNTLYRYFKTSFKVSFKRIRIETPDSDFLDLDIASVFSDDIVIAIHGLEGSSNSSYIKSLAFFFNDKNIDVIALNLRSCSGESNRNLASYHSGKTEDLDTVIKFIQANYMYKNVYLAGYSLGGNIVLKYMGEYAGKIPEFIKAAVGVSVPCDLKGSAMTISKRSNFMYKNNFLKTLKEKAIKKLDTHKNHTLNKQKIETASTFKEFDDSFTAPSNGFKDAEDYWKQSSCKIYLNKITKPTLLITALDDPFLNESCYPFETAENHKDFYILATEKGGHVGFCESLDMKKNLWLENTIFQFFKTINSN